MQQQQRPQSLLTMLPPEVQKQVLLLIKRLGDEKQAKQQLHKKCTSQEQQIEMLNNQIDKLKKQNLFLKSKLQNSFSMISKVRQNFTLNNKSIQKEGKEMINKTLPPTIKATEQYKVGQGYFSIQQANAIQESRPLQRTGQIEMPQVITARKPPRQQSLQHSTSQSKLSNRSNKKQQIQQLKQQIQVLSQQIKSKQVCNMTLADKMRRCEEIKNRYKKGTNNNNSSSSSNLGMNVNANVNSNMNSNVHEQKSSGLANITSVGAHVIANNPGYYSPKKSINSQYHQPMYQNNTNQSRKENVMVNNNNDINFQTSSKQQQQGITSNANSMQFNYQQQQTNHQQQQQQQNIQTISSSFLNNTSAIYATGKTAFKQPSFYDDNLLDLIQQMDP